MLHRSFSYSLPDALELEAPTLNTMSRKQSLGRILVTDGAGWLGSHIFEDLVSDKAFDVVASSVEP